MPRYRNVQRFRDGLVLKAHRLRVSLNSRLESNKEEEYQVEVVGDAPVALDVPLIQGCIRTLKGFLY